MSQSQLPASYALRDYLYFISHGAATRANTDDIRGNSTASTAFQTAGITGFPPAYIIASFPSRPAASKISLFIAAHAYAALTTF